MGAVATQTLAVIPCFRPSVAIRIGLAGMPQRSGRGLGAYAIDRDPARLTESQWTVLLAPERVCQVQKAALARIRAALNEEHVPV